MFRHCRLQAYAYSVCQLAPAKAPAWYRSSRKFISKQFEELKRSNKELSDRMSGVERSNKKLSDRMSGLGDRMSGVERSNKKLSDQMSGVERSNKELKNSISELDRRVSGVEVSIRRLTQEAAPRISEWVETGGVLRPQLLLGVDDQRSWPYGTHATLTCVRVKGDPTMYVIGAAHCAFFNRSFSYLTKPSKKSRSGSSASPFTQVYASKEVLECATHVLIPRGLLNTSSCREKDIVMFKLDASKVRKLKKQPYFAEIPASPVDPKTVQDMYVVGNTATAPVEGQRLQFCSSDPFNGIYVFQEQWGEPGNSGALIAAGNGKNFVSYIGVYYGILGAEHNASDRHKPRGVVVPFPKLSDMESIPLLSTMGMEEGGFTFKLIKRRSNFKGSSTCSAQGVRYPNSQPESTLSNHKTTGKK